MNNISRDTYEGMDDTSKLNVLFDYAFDSNQRIQELEERFDKKRKFDTAFSGLMGLIGGGLSVLGIKIFYK